MKVLITGGSGFIGSHLADRLLARGDHVLVVDNFATGRRDNLMPQDRLTIVEGSIADKPLLDRCFEEFAPDVVAHAAASYKDPNDWIEDTMTNVTGTVHVVEASQRAKVRRSIYFQTALCYGLHPVEQPITLDHPLHAGGSSYAISKTAAEQYIALSGLDFISFRLANCYGPRNISGPLPTFYSRLTGGKSCFCVDTRRDFVYVDDLIDVVMLAVEGQGQLGCYHVSSGRDYAIKELFDAVVAAMQIELDEEVEVRPRGADDVATILLDPSRTNEEFGWSAKTPLEAGVRRAVAYYQEFGVEQTYTHLRGPSSTLK